MPVTAPPLGLPEFRRCKSLDSRGIVTAMLKRLLPYVDPDVNPLLLFCPRTQRICTGSEKDAQPVYVFY